MVYSHVFEEVPKSRRKSLNDPQKVCKEEPNCNKSTTRNEGTWNVCRLFEFTKAEGRISRGSSAYYQDHMQKIKKGGTGVYFCLRGLSCHVVCSCAGRGGKRVVGAAIAVELGVRKGRKTRRESAERNLKHQHTKSLTNSSYEYKEGGKRGGRERSHPVGSRGGKKAQRAGSPLINW